MILKLIETGQLLFICSTKLHNKLISIKSRVNYFNWKLLSIALNFLVNFFVWIIRANSIAMKSRNRENRFSTNKPSINRISKLTVFVWTLLSFRNSRIHMPMDKSSNSPLCMWTKYFLKIFQSLIRDVPTSCYLTLSLLSCTNCIFIPSVRLFYSAAICPSVLSFCCQARFIFLKVFNDTSETKRTILT